MILFGFIFWDCYFRSEHISSRLVKLFVFFIKLRLPADNVCIKLQWNVFKTCCMMFILYNGNAWNLCKRHLPVAWLLITYWINTDYKIWRIVLPLCKRKGDVWYLYCVMVMPEPHVSAICRWRRCYSLAE